MKLRSLLIGILIILFGGCTKEDDAPAVENGKITVVYPDKTQDLNPCCINFQWNNPEEGNSRIFVSKNQNFTELILDSSLVSNNLILNQVLQPDTEYFWKVSNSTMESKSSFKIKDVLGGLKPTYSNIKIRRYDWDMHQGIWRDTTFYDTIKLTREGEKVRFEYAPDNINRLYSLYYKYTNKLTYLDLSGTRASSLEINYLNDSIFIRNERGGLGGGRIWEIKFKK